MNLTCAAANVNGAALPILIIQLVPNLIIASARGASRLLAGFRGSRPLEKIDPLMRSFDFQDKT